MIWNTVALTAPDQLKQRVAWALASIFVVTETDIAMEEVAESWTTYYDIFVRNSFGSFAQVLKEVSFSPMMGKMLTYEGSKSLAYQIEKNNAEFFPDENFARVCCRVCISCVHVCVVSCAHIFSSSLPPSYRKSCNYSVSVFICLIKTVPTRLTKQPACPKRHMIILTSRTSAEPGQTL